MAATNEKKAEASFYALLKDILETQASIVAKLESIERRLEGGRGGSAAELWKGM